MRNFERNLLTEWRRIGLPMKDATVVVAVSGGADSMSLAVAVHELQLQKKLQNRFVLAHFNHNLRGHESQEDEEFVRHFSEARGMELAVGRCGALGKGNLEQNARNARYEFLSKISAGLRSAVVLTAHTLDDQAETFLMNLIRGSGPRGLSGMPVVREIGSSASFDVFPDSEQQKKGDVYLVRPMLSWAQRSDSENYCHELGVKFRYDSMNEDLNFMRVRVRKLLIPMLREFNPMISETIARTADLVRFEFGMHVPSGGEPDWESQTLRIKELREVKRERLLTGLRAWLGHVRGDLRGIGSEHIEAVADLVLSTKSGRVVEIPGKSSVVKTKGVLTFRK